MYKLLSIISVLSLLIAVRIGFGNNEIIVVFLVLPILLKYSLDGRLIKESKLETEDGLHYALRAMGVENIVDFVSIDFDDLNMVTWIQPDPDNPKQDITCKLSVVQKNKLNM